MNRPGRIEIPPDARADKRLKKLADELGFNSVNLMLRHLANELSYCKPRQYFKAVSQFYEVSRRRP